MECLIFDHYFVFSTADCWLLLEKLDCCWLWLEKLNTPYFALAAVFLYLAPGSGDWTLRNEALPWDGLEGKRALTVVKGGGSKVPYIFNKITIKQNNLTPFSPSGSCCSKAFARGGGGAGFSSHRLGAGRARGAGSARPLRMRRRLVPPPGRRSGGSRLARRPRYSDGGPYRLDVRPGWARSLSLSLPSPRPPSHPSPGR